MGRNAEQVPQVMPLHRDFFRRHPAEVAPDLLGKLLVRQIRGATLCGRIVETEAYDSEDPASHTFRGRTERNKAMFGEVGHAYVYFIHGMHHCINVTARRKTAAGGVLIRALEPVTGTDIMRQLRGRQQLKQLASGPAKLTQALSIDKTLYGVDMTTRGALFIAEDGYKTPAAAVQSTPRIGISKAVDVLWRFVVTGSPYLSR